MKITSFFYDTTGKTCRPGQNHCVFCTPIPKKLKHFIIATPKNVQKVADKSFLT